MLALVLAVVSGVCLVVGWSVEQIILVYAAFGISVLGLLLVLIGVLRNKPINVPDADASGDLAASDAAETEPEEQAETAAPASAGDLAHEVFVERSSGDRLDADTPVYVLQRRKRFHVAGCTLVESKQPQELTLVEAREEDFTACSVCLEVGAAALLSEQR
ncbi:hypothetical protein REH65_07970 [Saccharopolyspora sp. ID03-671]|uniref:hypothetical protein n=1 Tax=Saccharopolyspora sp. ID03-671 TaxID=3073066 RepID=UPI00324E4FA2